MHYIKCIKTYFRYLHIDDEGPGQGEALKKYGVPFRINWEEPVGAVLDHFSLDDVTLFGLSMGGWYCLRAAAFEPRVKRVIPSGHSIDYLKSYGKFIEAMKVWLSLNTENIHSELVTQDVLYLLGREDHFVPFKMYQQQIDALSNARSVTGRVFTAEEHAQNHCQIGNIKLSLDVIIDWINEKTGR